MRVYLRDMWLPIDLFRVCMCFVFGCVLCLCCIGVMCVIILLEELECVFPNVRVIVFESAIGVILVLFVYVFACIFVCFVFDVSSLHAISDCILIVICLVDIGMCL